MVKGSARIVGVAAGLTAALLLLLVIGGLNSLSNTLTGSDSTSSISPTTVGIWVTLAAQTAFIYWAVTGFAYSMNRSLAFGRLFLATWGSASVLTAFAFTVGGIAGVASGGTSGANAMFGGSGSESGVNALFSSSSQTSGAVAAVTTTAVIISCFAVGAVFGFLTGLPVAIVASIAGSMVAGRGSKVDIGDFVRAGDQVVQTRRPADPRVLPPRPQVPGQPAAAQAVPQPIVYTPAYVAPSPDVPAAPDFPDAAAGTTGWPVE